MNDKYLIPIMVGSVVMGGLMFGGFPNAAIAACIGCIIGIIILFYKIFQKA